MAVRHPVDVMPEKVARAVAETTYWFVLGGQAMRCFCPYRPSRDVDFGVSEARDFEDLLAQLERKGQVEIKERSRGTVHLSFDGIDVSVFLLEFLAPFSEGQTLTVTGLLATKLHAILERGARRDFFDVYILLRQHSLGIAECLSALRKVYRQEIGDALILRALTYFDDAEREASLPGEGSTDWKAVKDFFRTRVGHLLVPPARELEIESRIVDVSSS